MTGAAWWAILLRTESKYPVVTCPSDDAHAPHFWTLDDDDLRCAGQSHLFGGQSQVESTYATCSDCDDITPSDETFRTHDDSHICHACAEDYFTCDDCDEMHRADDMRTVGDDTCVCESCVDAHYQTCADCGDLMRSDDSRYTLHDESVCEHCCDYHYSYCDDCDGYYHDDVANEHEHNDGHECGCESPAQSFTMRNDGDDALANDTRVTVSLPAGIISDEGIGTIARYLRAQDLNDLSWELGSIDNRWQTKEGNFTKRLSRFAYKTFGLKLSPEILSTVGTIARDHSNGVDFTIDVTRDVNRPAHEFAHDGSCWWTSHSEGRCALKTNGGMGMRTFGTYGEVSGRAWVMPLAQTDGGRLVATFDTLTPAAWVVFNGYGDLSGYSAARILSHMAGMTYRKIGLDADNMYVNAGGYLVAPEDVASEYTDGHLHLAIDQHSDLYESEMTYA